VVKNIIYLITAVCGDAIVVRKRLFHSPVEH
jgi:hypothetical protein